MTSDDLKQLPANEVIRQSMKSSGLTLDQVKRKKIDGVTRAQVKAWLEKIKPGEPAGKNPLERSRVFLMELKSDLPLQWLCGQAGGYFVPDPSRFEAATFDGLWFRITREMLELRTVVMDSFTNDGVVDRDEAQRIALEWIDVKSWIDGFLAWRGGQQLPDAADGIGPHKSLISFESWQSLRQALDDKEAPKPSAIAPLLGLSSDQVFKFGQDPDGAGSTNPFDQVLRFVLATGSLLPIKWLCAHQEGRIVANYSLGEENTDNMVALRETFLALGEIDVVFCKAVLDGVISEEEVEEISGIWGKARRRLGDFVRACEEGVFL